MVNASIFTLPTPANIKRRKYSPLHKLMRKDLKKSVFLSNLNSLAWYGSYSLWLSGEQQEYPTPPFLIPHLNLPSPATPALDS